MAINKVVDWDKGGIEKATKPDEYWYVVYVEPQPIMWTCSQILQPESDPHFNPIPVLYTKSRQEAFDICKEWNSKQIEEHEIRSYVKDSYDEYVTNYLTNDIILDFSGPNKVLNYSHVYNMENKRYLLIETENEGIIAVEHSDKKSMLGLDLVWFGRKTIANGIYINSPNNFGTKKIKTEWPENFKEDFITTKEEIDEEKFKLLSKYSPWPAEELRQKIKEDSEKPFVYTIKARYKGEKNDSI